MAIQKGMGRNAVKTNSSSPEVCRCATYQDNRHKFWQYRDEISTYNSERFEPRWVNVVVWVIVRVCSVVLRRTVVGVDWRFDNLSGSHHQSDKHYSKGIYGYWSSCKICGLFAWRSDKLLKRDARYRCHRGKFRSLSWHYSDTFTKGLDEWWARW